MARRLTASEKREIAQFVDWLFQASGAVKWADFAREAGVHWANLSAWHRGETAPSALNLIRLMRTARVLDESAPTGETTKPAIDKATEQVLALIGEHLGVLRKETAEFGHRVTEQGTLRDLTALSARAVEIAEENRRLLVRLVDNGAPPAAQPEAPQAEGDSQ